MKVGFYNQHPIDFEVYRMPHFRFKRFDWPCNGCGANALAMLTRENPWEIQQANRSSPNFKDMFMLKHMRQHNITAVPLTQCEMSNVFNGDNRIKKDHLLLVSQLLMRNEGSWVLIHKGKICHNNVVDKLYPLEFINRPIMSAYVLFGPQWLPKKK